MSVLVWVDGWQMECCGRPFRVGDVVEWTLSADKDADWLGTVLGPDLARQVAFREDHHGALPEDAPVTRGRVLAIRTARCRYAPRPGASATTLYPVPGTGVLTRVGRADGGRQPEDGRGCFTGYLVELDASSRVR